MPQERCRALLHVLGIILPFAAIAFPPSMLIAVFIGPLLCALTRA